MGSGGSELAHIHKDLLRAGTILGTSESAVNKQKKIFKECTF